MSITVDQMTVRINPCISLLKTGVGRSPDNSMYHNPLGNHTSKAGYLTNKRYLKGIYQG
jgi:hypothetical protein